MSRFDPAEGVLGDPAARPASVPGDVPGGGEDGPGRDHRDPGDVPGGPRPRRDPARPTGPGWWRRLDSGDREVLGWWGLTRLGFLAVLLMAPAVFAGLTDAPGSSPGLSTALVRWDAVHFAAIAAGGYHPGVPAAQQPTGVPLEAFFPGFPALLAAGHLVGLPYALTGVLCGLVFGAVAVVALGRLVRLEPGADPADAALPGRVALLWSVAPLAVFVAVPYSEAPFLALAFTSWLAARRRQWLPAVLLATGASCFRITGVYLALAVAVQFLVAQREDRGSPRTRRDWRLIPLFAVPLVPVLAFFGYLWAASGDPLLWFHVQATTWYRTATPPWTNLRHTLDAAVHHQFAPDYAWMFGAELVAFAVGIVLVVALLRRRRVAEAVYVATQLASYVTSYWLMSVPRATLTWWPLWTIPAVVLARRPWLLRGWVIVSAALAVVWAAAFLRSQWAG